MIAIALALLSLSATLAAAYQGLALPPLAFVDPRSRRSPDEEARVQEALAGVLARAAEHGWDADGARAAHLRASRQFLPPTPYVPDPNPLAVPIPPGAPTVRIGRTWSASPGSASYVFGVLVDRGLRTLEYNVNSKGGVMINGTAHLLEQAVYDDGGSCSTMIVLHERLVVVDRVASLLASINSDCPELALVAEAYQIPYINAADTTLPILMDSGVPGFANLNWTFNLPGNYWTLPEVFVAPAYAAGARTFVSYTTDEIPVLAQVATAAALALNMTQKLNLTSLSAEAQAALSPTADNCSYVAPFIDDLKAADPDLFLFTFGRYSALFIDCMHRRKYHPRALYLLGGAVVEPWNRWQLLGSQILSVWAPSPAFKDPYLGDPLAFTAAYNALFNATLATEPGSDKSYQGMHATAGSLPLAIIVAAQSTDPYDIAAGLLAFDNTTLFGPTSIVPGSRNFVHPFYAIQYVGLSTADFVYATVHPNATGLALPLVYPTLFSEIVPQWFLDLLASLQPSGLSTGAIVGIAVGCVLAIVLLGAVVAWLIVRHFNHVVFLKKDETSQSEIGRGDWDGPASASKPWYRRIFRR